MRKNFSEEEKKQWIEKIVESGKQKKAYYMQDLLKRFEDCSSGITTWIKTYTGKSANDYLTEVGAAMSREERKECHKTAFNTLKQRYAGKTPAKDYEALKADNEDVNFWHLHKYVEDKMIFGREEYLDFLAEEGIIEKTQQTVDTDQAETKSKSTSGQIKNTEGTYKGATQWYLSSVPMKASLEVMLEDGHKYKYRARRKVSVGDPVIIGRGAKSTGRLGHVTAILDLSATKKTYTAEALYGFHQNPSEEELKKAASRVFELDTFERVNSKYTLSADNFAYVDAMVEILLYAATVLAFPNLSKPAAIKKATACLSTKKTIPGFLYSAKMKNTYFWCWSESQLEYISCPEVIYSGYYPNWEKSFFALPIWDQISERGALLTAKMRKSAVTELNEALYDRDGVFQIGKLDGNYIYGCADQKIEKLVNSDAEYNEACNELIFRSAISILIQGDMANLLDAFLSAKPPVEKFADPLMAYAKELESENCTEILEKYF